MTTFPVYAAKFEFYLQDSEVYSHLSLLLAALERIDFVLEVKNQDRNRGQIVSNFDAALEATLVRAGASHHLLELSPDVPQELDFAFSFEGRSVAVEIEKANREKILRDILKCHMYLDAGANYEMIALPKNYPHTHGVWDLFNFGVQRFRECQKYGFGTPEKLDRILLVGFEQFCATTSRPLSKEIRLAMRKQAALQGGSS